MVSIILMNSENRIKKVYKNMKDSMVISNRAVIINTFSVNCLTLCDYCSWLCLLLEQSFKKKFGDYLKRYFGKLFWGDFLFGLYMSQDLIFFIIEI